jgi:hypothetical protein
MRLVAVVCPKSKSSGVEGSKVPAGDNGEAFMSNRQRNSGGELADPGPAVKADTKSPSAERSPSPTPICHILLELGREPGGHPYGDSSHLYHLFLPLTGDGMIDPDSWRKSRSLCRVRRQRPGEPEARGLISHGPGGRWYFEYSPGEPTECGFRLETERFTVGEYVSIKEDDDRLHTFQIVSIKPC